MNSNDEMLSGNVDADASYPYDDPNATQFEFRFC